MKFRVGACALLVCLAGCTAEAPDTKFGDQRGAASTNARTAQRLPSVQVGRQASQSVANAPDRGELISYKNKGAAIKREGAYTWYPVAISEAHALKAVVDGVMSIPSPDGSQVKVRYERHVEHPDGNWTWIGRVIGGDQRQEAILTFGEKAVYGSIPQKSGAPLSLQTRGGQLYAVQTDLSKVKNPNSRTDMMVPPALALRSALLASAPKAQVSQSAVETKAATPASTVDVAIGYTPGFATAQGSQSAAVTRLVFLVDVGNQAFTNSLITGALRLVNAVQVNYTDTTTNEAALGELTGVNNNEQPVPIPASLVPLRTARDQYGADLAVLVRKFHTPENDGCGIAWLNGSGQQPINPATDDDFGFAVISDGNDSEGTSTYFCADETLVHELGHLMGSAHDRDNSRINPLQPPGGANQLFGRYPYSFGLKTTAANGNFYTIMAYGSDGQNFYRTFSNPLVLKCGTAGNLACGIADQADNARSLNQTIPVVASFRAVVVPMTPAYNLYGINKVGGANKTEVFAMGAANNYATFTLGASTGLYATGTDRSWAFKFGNYNADASPDLYAILKAGSGTSTEIYVLNGADSYKTMLFSGSAILGKTGADNRWMFKLGDYNKDGKLDIYSILRTGSTGKTEIHILNGADNFKSYLLSVATGLYATGTDNSWEYELGDYNGDGTLDLYGILKTGSTGKTEVHILNGANNFQTYLLNTATVLYQTGNINIWNFKLGDFNRDGTMDIYAINKTGANNKTELFVMDGRNNFQTFLFGGPTAIYATGSNVAWEFELVQAAQ
jgi:peptidyl-Asp metalloendopeptidase